MMWCDCGGFVLRECLVVDNHKKNFFGHAQQNKFKVFIKKFFLI